jgi:hypothetical protein
MTYKDPLHVSYNELTVKYKGKPHYMLNKRLLDSQLAWDNLQKIKHAHWLKLMINDMILETDNEILMRSLAKDLTLIEFELQELWKFPLDGNFHRFWEAPKCTCPKLDNEDNYPIGYYTVNLTCPLHGREL